MKTLKAALVQQTCTNNKAENLSKSIQAIREAARLGAQLVVLQELHAGLYFCQTEDTCCFDQAEPIPGASSDLLAAVARECGVVIVASLFERRAPGIYHNTAIVLENDGTIAGKYRKMHIPDDPGFYEKFYFTPGDLGFAPIDTSVGRLGVLVCWDQWFPEAARLMTLSGAELLIYPTAIGWDPNDTPAEQERQRDAWITIQRSHAIANGLPVISANRVGLETSSDNSGTGILFWGSSFVTGCQGEILTQAGTEGEQLCTVEIDMTRCEDVRRIWPFLRDRRIDSYQDLLKRFCR
ncbi:MAG: carbon-nitrogen hydrolase [Geobacteraceae bacterium]|nr:carbon-nitrogen hydrolase [Geobacteraceae bacterium]